MADEKKPTVEERLGSATATLERMVETVEGLEPKLKEEFGNDLRAVKEEIEEAQKGHEERFKKIEQEIVERLAPDEDDEPDSADAEFEEAGYSRGLDGEGEFLRDILSVPGSGWSPRLRKYHERAIATLDPEGKRDLATTSGADGGVLMGKQLYAQILTVPDDTEYMRDMCRELPAGTPPNSELEIPYLDQSGSKGIYAGVLVYSAREAENLTNADTPKFKSIFLKPQKQGAYVVVTDELMANAPAAAGFIAPLFRGAQSAWTDDKIGTGTGAGEPKGFRSCSAVISVDRDTTNRIKYVDAVNMYVRTLGRGRYVWVCSKVDVLAELMTMTDGAGQLAWTTSAREGEPNRFIGLPVFYDELGPALGSAGDLMLVDLQYVLLKPGMPPTLKNDQGMSNFLAGKTTIKMTFWIDGQPWLQSPLTLRDGTNTVSPFVKLAA